jgi:transcriptional regulator with XRE-family HTH domain
MPGARTDVPIATTLPDLLRERGMSLRALGRSVGVSDAHLSRAVRGAGAKSVSGDLAGRVAQALGLPEDYFVEYRRWRLEAVLREDPAAVNWAYDRLVGGGGNSTR